ncbi:MAG: beta-glucosidase [Bacteroidia bacterium]
MEVLRKIFFILIVFVCCSSCQNNSQKNSFPYGDDIEQMIAKMSIEEKVGQMTQINIDAISVGEIYNLVEPHQLDSAKLDIAINKYFVGSFLNAGGHTYTREHWREIITTVQNKATTQGNKIPIIYGIDAIHGANYTVGATLFPQQIAQAATWNPDLVEQAASITAYDVSASGISWNFSPVLDLGRQPLWGRFFETYGEDVYLAKTMAKACVRGYQGDDVSHPEKVAACLKHFVGYSMPLSGKDRTPAWIPERQLREYFLPTFEAAIKEGALTLMINSGEVNGIPVHADYNILTKLLREELGFKGIAVTDWEDVAKLYKDHHIATDMKDAVYQAVMAGIDMSMTPNDYTFNDALIELVKEGKVPESRLDESVRRILWVKKQLGLFEKPYHDFDSFIKFGSEEHALVSLNAARECITMVKNEGALPISKTAKVLVTGPGANSLNYMNGGWTHTWQGEETKYNTVGKKTIIEAIKDIAQNVSYVEGASLDKDINTNKAIAQARNADVLIVCLAEKAATEGPADINLSDFPEAQQNLVKELRKTGKPIVLVTTTNRPLIMRDIEPLANAILIGYLPGDEGGIAIAETLFGDNNPSGKLPFTYPKYPGLHVVYDHKHTEKFDRFLGQTSSLGDQTPVVNTTNSQWDFGYGLSYSSFEYSNVSIDKKEYSQNDTIYVSIEIQNTSNIDGKEVVQVYVSDLVASVTPSIKRLRAFKKIEIKGGQSKKVKLSIPISELAFVNRDNLWQVESGDFELSINSQKINFLVK